MRRLDEILEECLSAYLDQGRSIEESLRLHSAYRGQLEPLLRTALEVSGTFQSYSPPSHIQERGLARFLSDARARKNLRAMTREPKQSWFAGLFGTGQRRMGFAGFAAATAVVTMAIGAAALSGGSSGPPTTVERPTAASTPTLVTNLRTQVDRIQQRVADRQSVSEDDLHALARATRAIENASDEEIASSLDEFEAALQEADAVLKTVAEQPGTAADPAVQAAVEDAQETTRDVAGGIGVILDTPTPTDTPTDTDAPTPAETPTDGPSGEPTATPVPTAPPTDAPPTDAPTATETPGTRGIPALS